MPVLSTHPSAPASLWVYRGQAPKGIGEGPGKPIAQGEQYIAASHELAVDGEFLDAIRPWMTLDSDPADHQRLEDRLEAWSSFRYRHFQVVVRLTSSGIYDRRAAYFAHGRAWPLKSPVPGFDPGLYLGRSELFERRDGESYDPFRGRLNPCLARPEQVAAESEVAARFLAFLLQGCVRRRPVVVAVPVAELATGKPLHALLSFARGALPAGLKPECRIRIYSRTPELFLRHLGTTLLALPEDMAGSALGVRRDAILLDRQGNLLAGGPLEQAALDYAQAVVERAARIPEGVALFSERYQIRSQPGLLEEKNIRAIQLTYNVAIALSESEKERGDLARSYLPRAAQRLGPGLDWESLITPAEWKTFPQDSLVDLLLLDPDVMSPGTRELLRAVERVVSDLREMVDSRLDTWWDRNDRVKVRRLLELMTNRPPLVSLVTVAEKLPGVPDRWLAEMAANREVFGGLETLVRQRKLDAGWARIYLNLAREADLGEAAKRFLQIPRFFESGQPWKDVSEVLLDDLRQRDPEALGLVPLLLGAGRDLDSASHLSAYLRLAELLPGVGEKNPLVGSLLQKLPAVYDSGSRQLLVEVALDPDWHCLRPSSLVSEGRLRQAWMMEEMADRLLLSDELVDVLYTPSLLQLGARVEKEKSLARLFQILDFRIEQDSRSATDTLIEDGWWSAWRRSSHLAPQSLRRAAEAWITSHLWSEKRKEALFEDWEKVLKDLPAQLTGEDAGRLWEGRRLWPWISPFEQDQLDALIQRASDLGALAELADILNGDGLFHGLSLKVSAHQYVLRRSNFVPNLHPEALIWLSGARVWKSGPRLNLADSDILVAKAGHRRQQALVARSDAVVGCLDSGSGPMQEALTAADHLYLWSDGEFLARIAEWMVRKGSLASIGQDIASRINDRIDGTPSLLPNAPRGLVQDLVDRGFSRAAQLFSPQVYRAVETDNLVDQAVRALIEGRGDASCWKKLADSLSERVRSTGGSAPHPLSVIAGRLWAESLDVRRALQRCGWETFEAAVQAHPNLIGSGSEGGLPVPLFELAASLAGSGGIGRAALRVIQLEGNRSKQSTVEWWRSLLGCIRNWRQQRRSPDDREDLAVGLILRFVTDLEGFEKERNTLLSALRKESEECPWTIPAEFGVIRS